MSIRIIWSKYPKAVIGIIGVIGLLISIGIVIWAINVPSWPRVTGFNGKTIWDLLDLLIVPAMLALVGILFSWVQRRTTSQIELDRQRETALQTYLSQMAELLLEKNLRNSPETNAEVRLVARAWTIILLRDLDGVRKGVLLRFLHETALIRKPATVILEDADLSGANLREAFLLGADLSKTKLHQADLNGARLSQTDLSNADLSGADLRGAWPPSAVLRYAILVKANLSGVDLRGVDLSNADLQGADLSKADLSRTNLEGARLEGTDLTGTKYNHTTIWPEGFDPKSRGAILVKDVLSSP